MAYGFEIRERRSPLGQNFRLTARRHTSFASVYAFFISLVDNTIEIDANPDIEWHTSRSGGAGGQTSTRLKLRFSRSNKPTGTVIVCQIEVNWRIWPRHEYVEIPFVQTVQKTQTPLVRILAWRKISSGVLRLELRFSPVQVVKDVSNRNGNPGCSSSNGRKYRNELPSLI
jgi:hypothetical protein